jgi:5'(3')-deoxyribonucleotidase
MKIVTDLEGTLINTPEVIVKHSGVKSFKDVVYRDEWYKKAWNEYVDEIKFYPDAEETILWLASKHDVTIVSRQENKENVREWYKKTELHDVVPLKLIGTDFTKPKFDKDTDVLIEDLGKEIRKFDGIVIMIEKEYNKDDLGKADYTFKKWSEVREIFEEIEG